MQVILVPQRSDAALSLQVGDDTLTINGESFDLSSMPIGKLPPGAIASSLVLDACRTADETIVRVLRPYGPGEGVGLGEEVLLTGASYGTIPESATPGVVHLDQIIQPTVHTQADLDFIRYSARARVRDELIATMATENMGRVRSGEWTTAQLIALASDPVMVQTINHMNTLSFELAASTIASSTNPLLTPEIKTGWVSKLQAHFYN